MLPFFLVATLIVFALVSAQFLSLQNLTNVARQSVYLVLVSLGQMLVLITGGFDLSVGTAIALTSVVSAIAMVALAAAMPDLVWVAILLGAFAGFAAALLIGSLNGLGVAQFGVSPFIMTLGLSVDRRGHRPVPDRRRACLGPALRVRQFLRLRPRARRAGSGAVCHRRDRRDVAHHEPNPLRRACLCGRRQRQGGEPVGRQHQEGVVLRLRDLRTAGVLRRDPADGARGIGRDQSRRNHRARIRSPPA